MVYKQYNYSPLTCSETIVIAPWIDTINTDWYNHYGGYHTGIDILAEQVYSISSGVVLQVGKDTKYYAVSVQYAGNQLVRYTHLDSVSVSPGQYIVSEELIGLAHKYVHFEYATREQGSSMWSVRIGDITYYKHNPEQLLDMGG